VTDAKTPTTNMVKGFEDVKPMVFAGIILLIPKIMTRNSMEKLIERRFTCFTRKFCCFRFGSVVVLGHLKRR
jgi:heme/copper-type cytochrome/quinol oxidase subunit 1